MEYTIEQLKIKPKQELIQIALDILKEKQPSLIIDSDDFESTAWGNSKEILVKFKRYIRFIPLKTEPYQYYNITVNLVTKQILPFESGFNFIFYIPSEEDKKKMDFIKEKAGFSKQADLDITITENEDNYWISKKSKTAFSKFFINKKTGFKSGVMEGSFSVNPPTPVLESIYETEEMVNLVDRDSITENKIIKIALALLKKKQPNLILDLNDYTSTVLGDSKNTLVQFIRVIRYIPLGMDPEKRISYDINVNLNTNKISPFDDTFESDFYIETKEDKKALAFIKKNTGNFTPDFENTIHEEKENYSIHTQNKYSLQIRLLNKKTGKEEISLNAHMDPIPQPNIIEDLDTLVEIK